MTVFHPDIPPEVARVIQHLSPDVKRSVKQAIRVLSTNPGIGEPLRRELEGFWKYRVKRFRVVYIIDRSQKIIRIVAVGHRSRVYEEMTERVLRGPQKN